MIVMRMYAPRHAIGIGLNGKCEHHWIQALTSYLPDALAFATRSFMNKEDKYGILWSDPEGDEIELFDELDLADDLDAELEEAETPEPVVHEPTPREAPAGVVYTRSPSGRIIEI
jgi:hypothetical protein